MSHLAEVAVLSLSFALACSGAKSSASKAPENALSEAEAAPLTESPTDPVTADADPIADDATASPRVETLYVSEHRATCQGEAPRPCLQVRATPSEPWRNLYANIEGFEYEESFAYELRVEVTPRSQPPADAPSLRYRLLEVVSKQKVER
jgi:hypothetical protein